MYPSITVFEMIDLCIRETEFYTAFHFLTEAVIDNQWKPRKGFGT